MKKEVKKKEESIPVKVQPGKWLNMFVTVIEVREATGGVQYLASIQQNDVTKEIRAVKL